ncbi:hypothetical protein [Shewanella sp. 10N.286.48.B5]|uniref:hypothetical protein n=1 Tax=Shewanella sp. 10N.286.48.B5 TaxID=1880834 RepID=UPI000C829FCA|nr:hypothetical protein [Shewanella sp. 10N.286.48.B5]PMH86250.1 hypothetical protein BCU57_11305 [Shewanella sp. 10N.286.48.B5]
MSAYANKALNIFQRKKQLTRVLSENAHILVQMSSAEFIELSISRKQKQGMSKEQAVNEVGELISRASALGKQYWDKHRDRIKTGSGFIPVIDDSIALNALAIEMKRSGDVFSTFKIATYSGKLHIIFQGYAGLRQDLTGTRYLANNPKVISMGVGKLGGLKTITNGGVLTIIISAVFHSFDQLMNDQKTWHHFIGGMAVDIAIAVGSMAISWALLTVAAAVTTVVVSGLVVIVVVGTVIGLFSSMFIDTKYWSNRIADALINMEKNILTTTSNLNYQLQDINKQYHDDPILFMHKLFGIPYQGSSLR